MFSYELYLTEPFEGKDTITITTNNKMTDLRSWLINQVRTGVLSKEVASSVLFVA